MSTNKTFSTETSERYSRALFEVANEANELDKIENDIKNFQLLLRSSQEIINFFNYEIIVVDDHSKDKSLKIVKKFSKIYPKSANRKATLVFCSANKKDTPSF